MLNGVVFEEPFSRSIVYIIKSQMPPIPNPENEAQRIAALASYNILDTLPERDFEELTLLASEICQAPIALISMIDEKRQWFKSAVGIEITESPRENAFCSYTILNTKDLMIVKDAREDDRFAENPFVKGIPNIVFYAGVPLVNEDGFALGSLCVIDHKPRVLTPSQINALLVIAKQVITKLELQRKIEALEKTNNNLMEANTFIQNFATTAAHDIKNPLTSILLTSQSLKVRLSKIPDEKNLSLVNLNISSTTRLLKIIDEMLEYSSEPASLLSNHQAINLNVLLQKVISMVNVPDNISISIPVQSKVITTSSVALEQIFLNLLSNAIRYNNKRLGKIVIDCKIENGLYQFTVADNGIGILQEDLDRIFHKNVSVNRKDQFYNDCTGLGLSIIKGLIKKLGGKISVESKINEGSSFSFSIKTDPQDQNQ